MSGRTKSLDRAGVSQRASRARAFLNVAEMLGGSASSAERAVGISNAVEAGIAAADAICGERLGHRSADDDHVAAVALLKQALPREAAPRNALHRLLTVKTRAQYGDGEMGASLLTENLERARMLVSATERILAGR